MKIVALKDVCRITNGGTPKSGIAAFWHGDVAWLTPAEMGKRQSPYIGQTARTISKAGLANSSAKQVPAGSVILSTRAPIGHLAINETQMAFNQGCRGLTPGDKLDAKFLYYFLYFSREALDGLGTGTTFKELSSSNLANFEIPLPPLDEQRRIVAVLDKAFAGIATATANAQKNLRNARALFENYLASMFATAVLSCQLVPLSELATDITDGDHLPPPKAESGVPFITIGNIDKKSRKINFDGSFRVSAGYFNALKPNRKPRHGDVLYTVTGSFGIPVLIEDGGEFCFQRHIGLVRPKPTTDSRWLFYLLLSPQVFEQANAGATGAAQKTVSLKVLRNLVVPKANLADQRTAVFALDALSDKSDLLEATYQRKFAALAELKQSLLQKAFAGELTTTIAEPVAPAANENFATAQFTAQVIAFAHRRHERQQNQKTFGHVKAQKVLHLVESAGVIDLGRQPIKDAAGPNDFQHMLRATDWAVQQRFFEFVPRTGGKGYDFKKLANYDALLADALVAIKPVRAALEKVIDLIVPMVSLDAELFVTVHAAWNNLIRDGVAVTDDAIVKAARDDWHSAKLKIPEHNFRDSIRTIKTKGMEPDGTAKYVGGQVKLI